MKQPTIRRATPASQPKANFRRHTRRGKISRQPLYPGIVGVRPALAVRGEQQRK